MKLLRSLRERLQHWWLSRLQRSDHLHLRQRNIYILPTSAGWMLALTLAVLLLASINYQLNLGYLLTFLLAGSAAASMLVCHANLRGLSLQLLTPEPVFAGQRCALRISIANPSARARYGVALAVSENAPPQWAWTDLRAQTTVELELAFVPMLRGFHALPRISAETRFPLGSFRAWSIWRPAAQLLVYPAPEAAPAPLPPVRRHSADHIGSSSARAGEDFDGVRAYRHGDPLKQLVWKKAAQALATGSHALVSRDRPQAQPGLLWLDQTATGLADAEAAICRLTAWVLAADRQGLRWGLELAGGMRLAPDSGAAHRQRCLEALALAPAHVRANAPEGAPLNAATKGLP